MRFFKRNETKGPSTSPRPLGEEAIRYSDYEPATVTGSFGRAADGDRVWPNPDAYDSEKAKFERSLEGLSPKEKRQVRDDIAAIEAEENPPQFIKGDDGEPVKNPWSDSKKLYVVEDPVYGRVAFGLPWVIHDETHHLSNEDMSEIGTAYARIKQLANEFASYTVLPQQWWINPAFERRYTLGQTAAMQDNGTTPPPPLKQSTRYFEDTFAEPAPWTLDSYALCRQTLADFGLNASYDFFGEKGIIPIHAEVKGGLIRTVTDDRHGTTVTEYDPETGRLTGQSTTRKPLTSTIVHHTEEKKPMTDGILPTTPTPTESFVNQRAYMNLSRQHLADRGLASLKVLHGNAVADEKALQEEINRLAELEEKLGDKVDHRHAKVHEARGQQKAVPLHRPVAEHAAAQRKVRKRENKYTEAVARFQELRRSRQNINQLLSRVTAARALVESYKNQRIRERDAEIERLERAEKSIVCPPLPRGNVSKTVVITFVKKFGLDANRYEYAAISPAGKRTWSVTGRTQMNGISWSDLLQFVQYNEGTPRFRQYALNSMTRVVATTEWSHGGITKHRNLFVESGMETPHAR